MRSAVAIKSIWCCFLFVQFSFLYSKYQCVVTHSHFSMKILIIAIVWLLFQHISLECIIDVTDMWTHIDSKSSQLTITVATTTTIITSNVVERNEAHTVHIVMNQDWKWSTFSYSVLREMRKQKQMTGLESLQIKTNTVYFIIWQRALSLSLSAYRNAWLCLHAAPLACFNIIVPHTVNVYSYQSNEGFAKDKVCRGKNIWNVRTSISCHGPHIKLHLTNQHTHTQPAPNYDFSLENKTHFFHITCRFMSVLWDFRFSLLKKCSTSLISSLLSQSHRI